MAEDQVYQKISQVGKVDTDLSTTQQVGPAANDGIHGLADKAYFDSVMGKENPGTAFALNKEKVERPHDNKSSHRSSIMDEVNETSHKVEVSSITTHNIPDRLKDIRSKTKSSIQSVRESIAQLEAPNTRVKGSYERPLSTRLNSVNKNLDILANRTGRPSPQGREELPAVDPLGSQDPVKSLPGPVKKFVSLLTEGQNKLEALDSELATIGTEELSATKLLAIQVKMGHVSHELELFSSLLNKAIESTKTVMNVQV
jgi:hypothetical protein